MLCEAAPRAAQAPVLQHPAVFPVQPQTLADFRVPGANLDGLYYLRDVVDADKLYAHIQKSRETGKKVRCVLIPRHRCFPMVWVVGEPSRAGLQKSSGTVTSLPLCGLSNQHIYT